MQQIVSIPMLKLPLENEVQPKIVNVDHQKKKKIKIIYTTN